MAARRLVVVMLVLLGISTAIAILAPDPAERATETGQNSQPAETSPEPGADSGGATGATGESGESAPRSDGKEGKESNEKSASETFSAAVRFRGRGQPETVCARPGSRLVLTVRTDAPVDISLPSFGRVSSATEYAPGVFDLLMPDEGGRYRVETLEGGRKIATVLNRSRCPGSADSKNP